MAKRRKTGGNRSMLDLPLRGDEKRAEPSQAPPEAPAAEETSTSKAKPAASPAERAVRPPAQDTHPIHRRRRPKRKKRRWPLFLILLLIIGAAGYVYYRIATPNAAFSVQTLDFGEQRVGGASEPLEIVVTNDGSRAMQLEGISFRGDAAAEFTVAGDDCSGSTVEPAETCTVALVFQPASNGWRTAALVLEGNAIGRLPLTGSGAAPVLIADRAEIDFGPQPVDGRSASRTLNLRNDGAAAMSVDDVALDGTNAADFSLAEECTAGELPPGESCSVRVSFTPRAAGARAATLRVDSDGASGTAVIALDGNGVWSGQPLEADTEELEFGKQRRGRKSTARGVTFVNRTSEPITVGTVRLDAGDSGFKVSGENCDSQTLAAGAECKVGVTFTPKSEGAAEATVAVATADGLETTIELSGTGVEPRLKLERSELDFGGIRVGFESTARAVLTNTGTDTVRFDQATISGRNSGAFSKVKDGCSDFSLAPGRTCSIELRLIPTASGDQSAELRVESDAAGGRKTVSLAGRGTSAKVSITPARLDFGTIQRPGASDLSLTLSNEGTARMQLQRFSVSGAGAADFVVSSIGCGESGLEAGGSCRVAVRFAPRTDGARAARLTVQHDAGGGALDVPLLGTALAARPGFRISETSMDFGPRPVRSRSQVRTLTVTNTGDGRLELQRISVEGGNARDFTMVPGTCDGAPYVAAKGSCTVGVRFTPGASGPRQATLRIEHNAGSGGTVTLRGQGSG